MSVNLKSVPQSWPRQLVVAAIAVCMLFTFGLNSNAASAVDPPSTPVIEVKSVSAYGTWPGYVSGVVGNIYEPSRYRLAPLIFLTGMGFFSKPFCTQPSVPLNSDGSFSALFTTGGVDQLASRIALVLVPADADVQCYANSPGIPEALEKMALAKVVVLRPLEERVLVFAGEEWTVKSLPVPVGPGGNLFSDSPKNVFVDADGNLHLKITKGDDGKYYCAEIVSRRRVGYGTFRVRLKALTARGPRAAIGFFIWADGELVSRELDILEVGQFGRPSSDPTNAQVVVQPWDKPGHLKRFFLPGTHPTEHIMTWEPGRVTFESYLKDGSSSSGSRIHEYEFAGPSVPDADSPYLNMRINAWLDGEPASDEREVEVVVESMTYEEFDTESLRPKIRAAVNAASLRPGFAPGGLFTLFGNRLALADAQAESTTLPTRLGETVASINGVPTPLLLASPDQITGQIPYEVPPGAAKVAVSVGEFSSVEEVLPILPSAPGIFTGLAGRCLAENADGTMNSPARPVKHGEPVNLYLTGMGKTNSPVASGSPAPNAPASNPLLAAKASLAGKPAQVSSLVLTPGLVGIGQAVVVVPEEAASGLQPVTLTIGEAVSNACAVSIDIKKVPPVETLAINGRDPSTGPGGTVVRIWGTGFRAGLAVLFGATPATGVTLVDSNTITAIAPPGTGVVDITVKNADGAVSTLQAAFTYASPAPAIVRLSENSGPPEGGRTILIYGSGFQQGLSVLFGSMPATSVVVMDSSTIRVVTPAGAGSSIVSLTITNPDGGRVVLVDAYKFVAVPPTVTAVTPSSGPAAGGGSATIAGAGFQPGVKVLFGGKPCPSVSVISSTSLRVVVPSGSGTVPVTATNPDGLSGTLTAGYQYLAPAPVLTGVSPATGPASGGTIVILSGQNFLPGIKVWMGGVLLNSVTYVDAGSVKVTTPQGAGTVSITVENPDGLKAALPSAFTFTAVVTNPAITAAVSQCRVSGTVSGAFPPEDFQIVLWARTDKFWIQPCDFERVQSVRSDGTFGPIDTHNGQLYLQLIRKGYVPPATAADLPAAPDGVNILANSGPIGTAAGCNVGRCPAQ